MNLRSVCWFVADLLPIILVVCIWVRNHPCIRNLCCIWVRSRPCTLNFDRILQVILNSQKWDLMFLKQSLDQLHVSSRPRCKARLVKSFSGLMESTGKSILDPGGLEHFTDSCFKVHVTSEIFSSSTDGGRFRQPSQRSKHWLWQMFLSCSSHRRWQQQWAR